VTGSCEYGDEPSGSGATELVRTSKRTPHFTITTINWLTLFKEVIAVYNETHIKPINTEYTITDW
jgi:hypothetical protein